MNYWQFRKVIDPMLRPLSLDEQAKLREEDDIAAEANLYLYVQSRCDTVDEIISKLPYKDVPTLKRIRRWAQLISDVQKKKKEQLDAHYNSHEHTLLYGTSKDVILCCIEEIRAKYDYLARVAIGIVSARRWGTSNFLPLDRAKWLEK